MTEKKEHVHEWKLLDKTTAPLLIKMSNNKAAHGQINVWLVACMSCGEIKKIEADASIRSV